MNTPTPLKKIGLLIGREWSWPSAFVNEINSKYGNHTTAEFVKLGGTFMDELCQYEVIIDRMSHEIPYYRSYMKYAALHGSYVINNPFTWSADDKFFGVALMNKLGLQTPRTVVLPNKRVEGQIVPESFRNLVYPMNWRGIIDYVGVPAILKDALTGGRRISQRVNDVDELIRQYDESDTHTMVLQETIISDVHIHCFVIGQTQVKAARYDMANRHYLPDLNFDNKALLAEMENNALKICQAYGYDMNMVEFVVKDDQAYVINPTNPAPDMDINLLTPGYFSWCVSTMVDFAVKIAHQPTPQFEGYAWYQALTQS